MSDYEGIMERLEWPTDTTAIELLSRALDIACAELDEHRVAGDPPSWRDCFLAEAEAVKDE